MKQLAIGILLAALAGCGSTSPPAKPAPTSTPIPLPTELPDRITGQHYGPWGTLIIEWQIDSDGATIVTQPLAQGTRPPILRTLRFTASPGALARLRTVLAPVERQAALGATCLADMTDQGFAHVDWRFGARKVEYQLEESCPKAEAGSIGTAIDAAERMIVDWSRTAPNPKVEDKPQ